MPRNLIDRLKLTAAQHRKLVEVLDGKAQPPAGQDGRQRPRYPYVLPGGLTMRVRHPGGTATNYLVRPRNISETGLGFFHAGFLYEETLCRFALRTRADEAVVVEGRVRHCRHVVGAVHEIGARFTKAIDLSPFIVCPRSRDAVEGGCEDGDTSDAAVAPALLCVEADPRDGAALRDAAALVDLPTRVVPDAGDALALLVSASYRFVLVGDDTGSMSPDDLLETLAAEGHGPRTVRWSAEPSSGLAAATLAKPVTVQALDALCRSAATAPLARITPHLVSRMWDTAEMRPLILKYLESLEEQAVRLQHHVGARDLVATAELLREMRFSGGSYGFPDLADAAKAAADALHRGDHDALTAETVTLLERCRGACAFRGTIDYAKAG